MPFNVFTTPLALERTSSLVKNKFKNNYKELTSHWGKPPQLRYTRCEIIKQQANSQPLIRHTRHLCVCVSCRLQAQKLLIGYPCIIIQDGSFRRWIWCDMHRKNIDLGYRLGQYFVTLCDAYNLIIITTRTIHICIMYFLDKFLNIIPWNMILYKCVAPNGELTISSIWY